MKNIGAIICVSIIAIVMIIIAPMFGLPHHAVVGLMLTAVSIIFIAVATVVFSYSRIVGSIALCIALVAFGFALHEFSIAEPAKQVLLLP